ncbi:MAG: hypothetical protein KBT03_10345 [Bacteroidales bacterium]|nr:hypothetical protein [Candidatus Scybalousia scybalohippi]
MKIKVKQIHPNVQRFDFITKGDWIDLHAVEEVEGTAPQAGVQYKDGDERFRDVTFDYKLIPLGFAMKLPDGFEAILAPRSSSFKNFGIVFSNSFGVIDSKIF